MIVRRGVRGGFWLHCCSAVLQLRKGQKIRTTGNQDDAWQVISRFSKNTHVPPCARVLGTLPCTSPSSGGDVCRRESNQKKCTEKASLSAVLH